MGKELFSRQNMDLLTSNTRRVLSTMSLSGAQANPHESKHRYFHFHFRRQNHDDSSNTQRLRISRLQIIPNPPRRQKEQRNKCSLPNLRIMMCSWTRACPTRPLPSLHSLQLSTFCELNNAVNLAVGVDVVLTGVFFFGFHVDCGYGEEFGDIGWERDLGAPVLWTVDFDVRCPLRRKLVRCDDREEM